MLISVLHIFTFNSLLKLGESDMKIIVKNFNYDKNEVKISVLNVNTLFYVTDNKLSFPKNINIVKYFMPQTLLR